MFDKTHDLLPRNPSNQFIKQATVGTAKKRAVTHTGNGAKTYSATDNVLVTQFGRTGDYLKPLRSTADIWKDQEELWRYDPETAIRFIFYLRAVSRSTKYEGQRYTVAGQGLRHESIVRMLWVGINHPDVFYPNLALFAAVGSWRDVFDFLRYDVMSNGFAKKKLNWGRIAIILKLALSDEDTTNLVRKYIPVQRARSQIKTQRQAANNIIAKYLIHQFGWFAPGTRKLDYAALRRVKRNGNAHIWQRLISQMRFGEINFDHIAGRALAKMVYKSNFLAKHGLTAKYEQWAAKKASKGESIKHTGYLHEVMCEITTGMPQYKKDTINGQFQSYLDKVPEMATSYIVVRDTSGSMSANIRGYKYSSNDVAKTMALYFAYILKGPFADHWIDFSSTAFLKEWKGKTPVNRWLNDTSTGYGSTNLQSVADLFVRMRKQGVPLTDFPTGVLLISDGEFNKVGGKTNFEAFKHNLQGGGFPQEWVDNFTVAIWDIPNTFYGANVRHYERFESETPNLFYFSGYSLETMKFLMSGKRPKNSVELAEAALQQDIFDLIQL